MNYTPNIPLRYQLETIVKDINIILSDNETPLNTKIEALYQERSKEDADLAIAFAKANAWKMVWSELKKYCADGSNDVSWLKIVDSHPSD